MSLHSQQSIDEKIIELKKRVELVEQLVGVSPNDSEEKKEISRKNIIETLSEVREIKEQMLVINTKGFTTYLQSYSMVQVKVR